MPIFASSSTLAGLHDVEPVYQGEVSECGMACVAMLLQALGIEATLADLRARHGASLLGMSLADLTRVLATHDVASDPVRFDVEALAQLPLPAILHVGGNHFVLAMRSAGNMFHVFDPAVGAHLMHAGMLAGIASGYAVILGEAVAPRARMGRRPNRMPNLRAWTGGGRLTTLMLMAAALSFVTPLFVGMTVDRLLGPDGMNVYWTIGIAFLLAVSGAFVFERICGRTLHRYCSNAGMLALERGFSRLVDNRLRYFTRRTPGELVERFSAYGAASVDRIRLGNAMLCGALVALVAIAIMAWLQPWLALFSMASIGCAVLIAQCYAEEVKGLRLEAETVAARHKQFLLETVQGITAWKSALGTRRRSLAYASHGHDTIRAWRRQADLGLRQQTAYALLGNIELLVTLGVAASAMTAGKLSFGEFYAFTFLRQIAFASVISVCGAWIGSRSNRIAEIRARDILDQERDANPDGTGDMSTLELCGLAFQHEGSPVALKDLGIAIRQGEKIAVLGASGSGKTTLVTLLSGLDLPQAGTLRIDGVATSDWQVLRRYCYLQTSFDILFSGSLLQNIAMFSPDADRAACLRLLQAVGLGQRIAELPAGIDTVVTEATAALSAGERQRLMVARALYAQRAVGIFDEPTANLDRANAYEVMKAITSSPCAAVVVTHDRAHLHLFESVYVLRDGRLIRVSQSDVPENPS